MLKITEAMRLKAKETREKNKQAGLLLRQDFADKPEWLRLASEQGVSMPSWWLKPTSGNITKFMKKIDVSIEEFKLVHGISRLSEFEQMNPEWPMWALFGLMLEWKRDLTKLRSRLNQGGGVA